MNTKWSFAVILGLSALFGTKLRASQYGYSELMSYDLTPSMRANAIAAHKNLGPNIDLQCPKWIIADQSRAAATEEIFAILAQDSFAKSVADLGQKCHTKIREVHVAQSSGLAGDSLSLGAGFTDTLARAAQECERVYGTLAEVNKSIAPRVVSAESRLIFSGKISSNDATRWASEFKSATFKSSVREFEDACKRPIPNIKLSDAEAMIGDTFELNTSGSADKLLTRLQSSSSNCRSMIPVLAEFNVKYGLRHGLLFKIDLETMTGSNAISPEQLKAWTEYFGQDSKRLDGFRATVLHSKPFAKSAKKNAVIPVEMSTFWGASDSSDGLLSAVTRIIGFTQIPVYLIQMPFGGSTTLDPATKLLLAKYDGIYENVVYLNGKDSPHVPDSLNND